MNLLVLRGFAMQREALERDNRGGARPLYKELRRHNRHVEAWRDGIREARGLQRY